MVLQAHMMSSGHSKLSSQVQDSLTSAIVPFLNKISFAMFHRKRMMGSSSFVVNTPFRHARIQLVTTHR